MPVNSTESDSRLRKALDRLRKMEPEACLVPIEGHEPIRVCCFQTLHWMNGSDGIRTFPWRTSKIQELFSFLIHHRHGPSIRKEILIELLWPEQDPKRAGVQLHTTVYQMRKMLKEQAIAIQVVYEQEGYRLKLDDIQVDVDIWGNGLMKASSMTLSSFDSYKRLLDMYKGNYLSEPHFLWAESNSCIRI